MSALAAMLGGGGGLAGLGGVGASASAGSGSGSSSSSAGTTTSAAAAQTEPPETRFATQLATMQEMGLTDTARNIRALVATGGNVQYAIDRIFSGAVV